MLLWQLLMLNITPTLTLTLLLILILTLPWTKNPIITLTLTLCCWRYHHRSNCRRSKCRITVLNRTALFYKLYCIVKCNYTVFNLLYFIVLCWLVLYCIVVFVLHSIIIILFVLCCIVLLLSMYLLNSVVCRPILYTHSAQCPYMCCFVHAQPIVILYSVLYFCRPIMHIKHCLYCYCTARSILQVLVLLIRPVFCTIGTGLHSRMHEEGNACRSGKQATYCTCTFM